MKKFLVHLTHTTSAFIPISGRMEMHETDCPNKARRLLRHNAGKGNIMHATDKTIEEWQALREYYKALKVTWIIHNTPHKEKTL